MNIINNKKLVHFVILYHQVYQVEHSGFIHLECKELLPPHAVPLTKSIFNKILEQANKWVGFHGSDLWEQDTDHQREYLLVCILQKFWEFPCQFVTELGKKIFHRKRVKKFMLQEIFQECLREIWHAPGDPQGEERNSCSLHMLSPVQSPVQRAVSACRRKSEGLQWGERHRLLLVPRTRLGW